MYSEDSGHTTQRVWRLGSKTNSSDGSRNFERGVQPLACAKHARNVGLPQPLPVTWMLAGQSELSISKLASFPDLPLPFAFTIIHGSGRLAKNFHRSSNSVYYCKCKREIKTGEAWDWGYLEATLGLVKRLEISKELICECVTVSGCCCCMSLLYNHLMDSCSYVHKNTLLATKGGCICTPLTPLNPPLN